MHTLTIKLTSINYAETLRALYPYLTKRLETSQKHPLLLHLYHGMEGKSEVVADKLFPLLPEAEQNGLLKSSFYFYG